MRVKETAAHISTEQVDIFILDMIGISGFDKAFIFNVRIKHNLQYDLILSAFGIFLRIL